MAVRKNESMGFVDAALADLGGPRSAAMLDKLDAATPWESLAAPIRALPEYNNKGAGHPPWCPVLMLKCPMLAKWNGLSDPGLEEALKDRISFRKFVGLSFTDKTPDETIFVRFRDRTSSPLQVRAWGRCRRPGSRLVRGVRSNSAECSVVHGNR